MGVGVEWTWDEGWELRQLMEVGKAGIKDQEERAQEAGSLDSKGKRPEYAHLWPLNLMCIKFDWDL